MYDIVIVGGGPAGLTAAVYGLRAGKSVLIIEKNSFGGQIASSPKVENIPGIKEISGQDFADNLFDQATSLGADIEIETVKFIEKNNNSFLIYTDEGSCYTGKTIILAVGVKHRTLGLPGEETLIGNGISFCAVCDGAFYSGLDVAMIGGGNSALQEALLLSKTSHKITIIQNLADFTGERKLVDLLMQNDNVETIFNTVVIGYETENGKLVGLHLKNANGEESHIKVDGVFLAVGLIPENKPFASFVKLDSFGYFDIDETCMTDTEGLFIAGDCRRKTTRQVVTATSDGAIAAIAACKYLDNY